MSFCIAVVGRANVGKSSLFNAIYGQRVAIVDPAPGVTRDRIAREIPVSGGRAVELVDTGGAGMESVAELAADVDMQIAIAISRADLVLFVVDARSGLQPGDREIAGRLRAAGKDVMLVANKAEGVSDAGGIAEFHRLGLGEALPVSAAHGKGLEELKGRIRMMLPESGSPEDRGGERPVRMAVIGCRNAGKSTLINYLAGEKRVLVSELAGTTRDSVDVRLDYRSADDVLKFIAIDTAGVRRKKQIRESVDFYSQVRTHEAIRRADVVVLMIDACRPVSKVDKQWGGLILENYKPVVLAINKIDLVSGVQEEEFVEYVWEHLPGLRFAPLIFTSAATGENAFRLLELVYGLYTQSGQRVRTSELNEVMKDITARRPPPTSGRSRGKILFATQVGVRPPCIALFVNDSADITDSYRRYITGELRSALPYPDVPVRLLVRRRGGRKKACAGPVA